MQTSLRYIVESKTQQRILQRPPEEVPVTPEEVPVTPEQVPVTPEQVQPQVPVTDEPSLEDYDRLIRFLDKMLKM
jgi:hypothetical protein